MLNKPVHPLGEHISQTKNEQNPLTFDPPLPRCSPNGILQGLRAHFGVFFMHFSQILAYLHDLGVFSWVFKGADFIYDHFK